MFWCLFEELCWWVLWCLQVKIAGKKSLDDFVICVTLTWVQWLPMQSSGVSTTSAPGLSMLTAWMVCISQAWGMVCLYVNLPVKYKSHGLFIHLSSEYHHIIKLLHLNWDGHSSVFIDVMTSLITYISWTPRINDINMDMKYFLIMMVKHAMSFFH